MMTIQEAQVALRRGQFSVQDLMKEALSTIGRLQGTLNAFITVLEESAMEQARAADEMFRNGADGCPLLGIPIALKDVFSTRGIRTTCGSPLFSDHVPGFDCAVAQSLAKAGAVLTGKTNMHELAYGITSANPHFGPVHNPWETGRIPGGSSGGSGAAVASGMVFMAMGTDTGGSIRIPAAYCGTVGLKPTFGRVSRFGVMPLDFSLDHMGPLTRTVRDAAIVLSAIAGFDERDDTSSPAPMEDYAPPPSVSIRGLRIGVPENFYTERLHPDVSGAFARAGRTFSDLGANVVPVRVPDIDAINTVGRILLLSEASALMEPFVRRDRSKFGPDVLALLDQGRFIPAADYVNAQRLRRLMKREFGVLFRHIDCLITPTVPIPAPMIGQTQVELSGQQEDVRLASTRFVRGINVLGLPALALPCGFSGGGLPIGLQIIGKAFDESLILRVGAAFEDATDYHRRSPAVL